MKKKNIQKTEQQEVKNLILGIKLNWKINEITQAYIQVSFKLENQGLEDIYVLSQLVSFADKEGFELVKNEAILLSEANNENSLELCVGYVAPPISFVLHELLPGAIILKSKEILQDYINIPIPLRAWHPNEGPMRLRNEPKTISLKIGVLPIFCEMNELLLTDNKILRVPNRVDAFLYQQWITSDKYPLPENINTYN